MAEKEATKNTPKRMSDCLVIGPERDKEQKNNFKKDKHKNYITAVKKKKKKIYIYFSKTTIVRCCTHQTHPSGSVHHQQRNCSSLPGYQH